jgi:23S rRNA pseudouridine2605 synthase
MPRDSDKHNDSPRGRRDRPDGGKGRSGKPRGPEKKFAKRGLGPKKFDGARDGDKPRVHRDREERPYRRRDGEDTPRREFSDRPRFKRDDRGDGDKRPFKPRGERRDFDRGDRPPRGERSDRGDARPAGRFSEGKFADKRPYEKRERDDRPPRRDRDDARPAGRFADKKFGDRKPYASRDAGGEKRPYTPRGGGFRKDDDRPRGDRPERKFGGDRKFSRGAPDRGPRKDFGSRADRDSDRGDAKPWQKRDDRGARPSRPSREGERSFDKPRFDRPREDRPKFDRPRQRPEGRTDWQEHPRSDSREDRPRRENEDDSKIFAKRPAFGGRGAYRERKPEFEKREREPRPPRVKKSGERIAKVVSRAGLASRRDAEEWITQGRVTVNGRVINSPALDVTDNDVVVVDGKPLPPRERTRLFMFHKPRGLMTTHADPEGRPTVFDHLPEGLPRLISIGRLDFNTEGLLLLTNDGGLARALELPDTGWLRRYRVRAHGEVTQAQLDELKNGVEVDGVKYGSIDATLERDQGANVWLVFAIREGKNREVRNVMAHLGLEVNRLIRVSYGPFQLGELEEGKVEEVKTRVLREQLGEKLITLAGADFDRPGQHEARDDADEAPRGKKPFKPAGKSALVSDRKGRRVLVQRSGSAEARARNEEESAGYGPPRRPKRGYHGKRDLKPRDE